MPNKTTADLLNILFAELNNLVAPIDPSDTSSAPTTFVTTMFPGVTVLPADFNPSTTDGQQKLYSFMNQIPAVNKHFIQSGRSCPDMYKKILSAKLPPDDPKEAEKQKGDYEKALALLDDDNVMEKYDKYKRQYTNARNTYFAVRNRTDLPTAEQAEKGRQAKAEMDDAFKTWSSRGRKSEVENAMAVCASYLAFTPTTVFSDAQRAFEEALVEGVGYPVTCIPDTWATAPDSLSWTNVIIKQNSSESHTHHDVQKLNADFSAEYRSGPWKASASGGYHNDTEKLNKSSSVEKLAVSFQVARVEIQRDWFTSALLTYSQAIVPGQKAGSICAGSLAEATRCDFPFLPTAFLVVRNVNIYNQFSSEELNFLHEVQSWDAKASVGYGPFSLNSSVSHSRDLTDEEKKEFEGCTKLTMGSGMQLIGFLNTILTPAFPARDAANSTMSTLQILSRHHLTMP